MSRGSILELDEDSFDAAIRQRAGLILVEFHATWCPPCKGFAALLGELAGEWSGRAQFVRVDVDASGELVARFGIRSVPTLMLFKDGRVVDQLVGAAPRQLVGQLIAQHVTAEPPPV